MSQFVAIEAGATRTRAGLYDRAGVLVREIETGPANPLELGVHQAAAHLARTVHSLVNDDTPITSIIAGVAGSGIGAYAADLAQALCRACHVDSVSVANDILPVLKANLGDQPGILVIAGTGSSVLAQDAENEVYLVGGHGALLGDRGSAYRIGLEALQACTAAVDGTGPSTALNALLLKATDSSNEKALAQWAGAASKSTIASLASAVIECAQTGDLVAQEIVSIQATHLASQTLRARTTAKLDTSTQLLIQGGLLTHADYFAEAYRLALSKLWPDAKPAPATHIGHYAVSRLAQNPPAGFVTVHKSDCANALPGTEGVLATEKPIDTMSALEITDWMTQSDSTLPDVLRTAREAIAVAIDTAASSIARGGRIIYLGAGTSGRLGVLDASECPPTFGIPSDRVVGLIAGGDHALRNSIENAEDSPDQAVRDLQQLSPPVSEIDFVIGITASGTTPYVLGALEWAHASGVPTCLMSCNPVTFQNAQQFIVLNTGPEVLPGSTRLKAGSATKLALNQITTGAMARCGHIYEGYMVGVKAVNVKLRDRTIRITALLLELPNDEAEQLLAVADGDIKVAVLMHRHAISNTEAANRLLKTQGNLRAALNL